VDVTDRGVSTVLDVTLGMVLVGAAVLVLTGAPSPPTDDVGTDAADGVAETLGGTTVEVNYSLSPGARRADESLLDFPDRARSGPGFRRTAHGPIAGLLARAATGNVAVDGEQLTHATDELERRIGETAVRAGRGGGVEVQVRAVWRPFPGSDLRGQVVAGPTVPDRTAVHAATMNVSSGYPAARHRAVAAADDGFPGVADVLAEATVRGLFPPERTGLALRGDYPLSALVTYRYLHAADLLDTTVEGPIAAGNPRPANRQLADALATRFERTLRANYPTPEAAAANASVGVVTVTVRTWSA
jgi:hypothetical protein